VDHVEVIVVIDGAEKLDEEELGLIFRERPDFQHFVENVAAVTEPKIKFWFPTP
jgi:hypothetical protein